MADSAGRHRGLSQITRGTDREVTEGEPESRRKRVVKSF